MLSIEKYLNKPLLHGNEIILEIKNIFPNVTLKNVTYGGIKVEDRYKFSVWTTKVDRYDTLCSRDLGYKIIVHSPDETPNIKRNYFQVSADQNAVVKVKPRVMKTSQNLRRISPSRRQCYFEYESKLRYFSSYTQSNCDLECLSNFTLKACGCVKYFMVRDNSTEICNISKVTCLVKSRTDYAFLKHEKIWEYRESKESGNCNCLHLCNSVFYDMDVSQVKNYYQNIHKRYF